jgi:hypothetical protein
LEVKYDKIAEVLLKLDGKQRNKRIHDCLSEEFYTARNAPRESESPHSDEFILIQDPYGDLCVACSNHLELALKDDCKVYEE